MLICLLCPFVLCVLCCSYICACRGLCESPSQSLLLLALFLASHLGLLSASKASACVCFSCHRVCHVYGSAGLQYVWSSFCLSVCLSVSLCLYGFVFGLGVLVDFPSCTCVFLLFFSFFFIPWQVSMSPSLYTGLWMSALGLHKSQSPYVCIHIMLLLLLRLFSVFHDASVLYACSVLHVIRLCSAGSSFPGFVCFHLWMRKGKRGRITVGHVFWVYQALCSALVWTCACVCLLCLCMLHVFSELWCSYGEGLPCLCCKETSLLHFCASCCPSSASCLCVHGLPSPSSLCTIFFSCSGISVSVAVSVVVSVGRSISGLQVCFFFPFSVCMSLDHLHLICAFV